MRAHTNDENKDNTFMKERETKGDILRIAYWNFKTCNGTVKRLC